MHTENVVNLPFLSNRLSRIYDVFMERWLVFFMERWLVIAALLEAVKHWLTIVKATGFYGANFLEPRDGYLLCSFGSMRRAA